MWELPELLRLKDGDLLSEKEEWIKQKEWMRTVLSSQLYGHMPPAPDNLSTKRIRKEVFANGNGLFEKYDLIFGKNDALRLPIYVMRPNTEEKVIPVILAGGFLKREIAEWVISQKIAVITFDISEICPDQPEYKSTPLYREYSEYDWKVIAMWAWLQSRCIDWVESQQEFDCNAIVATGHSRFGKSAICCAVYDERVKVCVPVGSGCGGMGSLRVSGGREGADTSYSETLGTLMDKFPQWFVEDLKKYGSDKINMHHRENELIFDANWLGGCIAPRNLLILEGLDDSWSNPYGTFATWKSLSELYQKLNIQDGCAIHFREGGHAFNLSDWEVLVDFVNVHYRNASKKSMYRTMPPAKDFGETMKQSYGSAFTKPDRWLFDE